MKAARGKFSVVVSLLITALLTSGCILPYWQWHEQFAHSPPPSRNISRVIEGKTTRQEVVQYLGQPDLIVDGTSITLRPDGPLSRFQRSLYRKRDKARRTLADSIQIGPKTSIQFDPDEWARLQPYSSINEKWTAFFYWEVDSTYRQFMSYIAGVSQDTTLRNKLLVLINKETGIVEIVSYREEFKVD